MIKYLSPTSLEQFETNPTEFVLQRIHKGPRLKQTVPMAVGSVFDFMIKSHLMEKFDLGQDDDYGVEVKGDDLVEAQRLGTIAFDEYCRSAVYRNLVARLRTAKRISMVGDYTGLIGTTPVRGKPDLEVDNYVYDWKCNGFCSQASPVPGYVGHRDYMFTPNADGIMVNVEQPLFKRQPKWIAQLSTYNLQMLHTPPFVGLIHQLVKSGKGVVKIVEHAEVIPVEYVESLVDRYAKAWEFVSKGHYFTNMTKSESDKKVEQLGEASQVFKGTEKKHEWFRSISNR